MRLWSRVVMAAVGVAFALSAAAAYAAPPPPPSAPRSLKATAGDHQVTLTWSPPSTGVPSGGYNIITAPADFPRTFTSATTITATGLTNGTTYAFAVRGVNDTGFGPAARATATPHAIPPGAPNNLGATQGPGSGQITLSWTPPTSSGSSPLDHYTVTVSPGGISQQTNPATTTYVASNLADNITYTFAVTATNTEGAIGPAATVFAPLPTSASIGLDPSAGGPTTAITSTGQAFLKNESITLYWDDPSHVAASVVTDNTGAFSKAVKPFAGDKPRIHKLCASVPPKPCATFTLQGPPSPTPTQDSPTPLESPSPSSSPTATPQASGSRVATGGGTSGLDIITRPPFVFLLIIGILGLLGVIAYWVYSGRRRPQAPVAASVVHLATRPDYMAPFPTAGVPPAATSTAAQPPAMAPPAQPPPPGAVPPLAPEAMPPSVPPAPVEPPVPPIWPVAPDEPPDLPEPGD